MTSQFDPAALAADLRSACDVQSERWEKLAPFRDAGWRSYQTDVYRDLACNRLSADYKRGRFELFFFGVAQTVSFDSAKEALDYVAAVEKDLGSKVTTVA